ncbi:MAG: hypothetical protein GY899_14770 [Verrucomicrobiaceae bacterium]|nr:hypothetical protein [Verrucomicrobiaceae bacterium]
MTAPSSNHSIILDPDQRVFPEFSLKRLLSTVFEPLQDCRICILTDFSDPANEMQDYAFLASPDRFPVQCMAHAFFFLGLRNGVMSELSMSGGDMFAFSATGGSNLDMEDSCFNSEGLELSLDRDIYPNYDIILCISDWSATAPLTAKCREFGFRGATLHGLNDIILQSGLAVDYLEVSQDTEKLRLALTGADEIEIDFTIDDGRILTIKLLLGGQEAQKSHGLCRGKTPDVANLPAGEVYFVPVGAEGQFPMRYEDGTVGILDVGDRNIISSTLHEGEQETIDAHNARLADDPMTGTLGELGFGTQVLPVSGADIQDEKILGTCHIATGRDDHLGGDIMPGMFKVHENSTHDDILFAPHKTPNIDISQVRMIRGAQQEVLIEHFKPGRYLIEALA